MSIIPNADHEAPTTTFIDYHGFVIDSLTGEVLEAPAPQQGFQVRDRSSAEWVLAKLQELEAERQAIAARRIALDANLRAQQRDVEARIEFLRYRFEKQLYEWARSLLKEGGPRHIKTDYGRIGFRRTLGSIKVLDNQAAVAWAERVAPESIVVEKRLALHRISQSLRAQIFERPETFPWFEVETPGDKPYITSGLPLTER